MDVVVVKYDGVDQGDIMLVGVMGIVIYNVVDGVVDMDVVNKGQFDQVSVQVDNNSQVIDNFDICVSGVEGQINDLNVVMVDLQYIVVDGVGDGSDMVLVVVGFKGVVFGFSVEVGGDYGMVVGGDSYVVGLNDIVFGGNVKVNVDGSMVVGVNIIISVSVINVVVVGESVLVSVVFGIVLGQVVLVMVVNVVVLGQGLVVDCVNMVLVGMVVNQWQVINVVVGMQVIDVVNVGQVDEVLVIVKIYVDVGDVQMFSVVKVYVDQKFFDSGVSQVDFNSFCNQVDDWFCIVDKWLDQVGVMGLVMLQMVFSIQGINQFNWLGVGVGGYGGCMVLVVGYLCQVGSNVNVIFGGVVSGNESSVGVGVGIGW